MARVEVAPIDAIGRGERSGPGVQGSAGAAAAKRIGARAVLYSTATFFALFAALPFAWMILTVFKTDPDLYFNVIDKNPFLYNESPTLDNLRLLFQDTNYLT
jgi:ABC-type glycerol-3-phosphate transport system permease component